MDTNSEKDGRIIMNEEELKEYVKCRKDPVYFFKTYGATI